MEKNIVIRIRSEFERRQLVNPNYSLRGFAKHMGVNVSVLSRIMNNKMPMTLKLLNRMAVALSLSPEDFEIYEGQISSRKSIQSVEQVLESSQRQLEVDEFKVIQDWYNFVILELVKLHDFQPSEKWVSKKLSITEEEALLALERLVRLELLVQNEDGSFMKSATFVSIIQLNFSTVAMRNRQKQVLQRAINVMDEIDFSKRDQSAITISLDSTLLPEIKTKIKKMRRSLANYISKNSKKRDQVYELSVSFFPWSE